MVKTQEKTTSRHIFGSMKHLLKEKFVSFQPGPILCLLTHPDKFSEEFYNIF